MRVSNPEEDFDSFEEGDLEGADSRVDELGFVFCFGSEVWDFFNSSRIWIPSRTARRISQAKFLRRFFHMTDTDAQGVEDLKCF